MGQDKDFGMAFAKTQMAAKPSLPMEGNVFLSVKDSDKRKLWKLQGLVGTWLFFHFDRGNRQISQ